MSRLVGHGVRAVIGVLLGGWASLAMGGPLCSPVELTRFGGTGRDIARTPERTYLALETGGVVVLDQSAGSPVVTGALPLAEGIAWRLDAREGLLAIAARGSGVSLFSIEDPDTPAFIAQIEFPSVAVDVEIAGGFVYGADALAGVVAIERAPAPAITGVAPVTGTVLDLEPAGGWLVASTSAGLSVLSLADPALPEETAVFPIEGGAAWLSVWGSLGAAGFEDGALIFEIDPAGDLRELARIPASRAPNDFAMIGDLLIAAFDRDVRVYDLSDPRSPAPSGEFRAESRVFALDDSGGVPTLLTDTSLYASIEDLGAPTPGLTGSVGLPSRVEGVDHLDGLSVVGDGEQGVLVIDASTPGRPAIVGGVPGLAGAGPLRVLGDRALVTTHGHLVAVDLSVPASPTEIGRVPLRANARAIETVTGGPGSWAFVATDAGIEVFSFSDGSHLAHAGFVEQAGIGALAARPPLLAACASTRGTLLFDIAIPTSPALIGTAPSIRANGVAFTDGGLLCVAESLPTGDPDDLLVFDLADPTGPELVRSYAVPGTLRSIAFDSGLLHIGATGDPVAGVFTVDPHATPGEHLLGEVAFPGWPFEIVVAGTRLLVASSDAGLVVVDDSGCHAPGCDASDLGAPFGEHSASDFDRFVELFGLGAAALDRAAPIGILDLADLIAFVGDYLDGCP